MTTTITVQTSACPAAVQINSHISSEFPTSRYYSNSSNTTFVPPETKASFSISSDASFSIQELPKEATSLDDDPRYSLGNCSALVVAPAQPVEPELTPDAEPEVQEDIEPAPPAENPPVDVL